MGKILVVEDNAFLRKMVSDRLTQEGHTVIQAQDGQEGLDTAIREHPELILLDIIMPRMDGLTMLQKFREHEGNDSTPVIILSSIETQDHIQKAKEHNVFRYLIKNNTDTNALVDTVNFVLADSHSLRDDL